MPLIPDSVVRVGGVAKKGKVKHKRKKEKGTVPSSRDALVSPLGTAVTARRDKEARESVELIEMRKSVQRLRDQRALVERIKRDTAAKDEHIQALESLVHQLRSKLSVASLEALERERNLRSQLVAAEQSANATRETEEALSLELRKLLDAAQRTESDLRHDLARSLAEDEENRNAHRAHVRRLEHDKSALHERVQELESQVVSLRKSCSEQGQRAATAEQRLFEQGRAESSRAEVLEVQLAEKTSELNSSRARAESMLVVYNRNRQELRSKETALAEAETRERLLQSTVKELEENIKLLRDQVSMTETGDAGLRRQLAEKSEQLMQADQHAARLKQDLESLKLESRMTVEECGRHKDKYEEYQINLRNAAVHRQRMEVQLKSLHGKVDDLQRQLVHEMQRNAMLSRELDEERKSRTLVSKERLKLLSEFYQEETRLKETLDQQEGVLFTLAKEEHAASPGLLSFSRRGSPTSSCSSTDTRSASSSGSHALRQTTPRRAKSGKDQDDLKEEEEEAAAAGEDINSFFRPSSPATVRKKPKQSKASTFAPLVAHKSTASSRAKAAR